MSSDFECRLGVCFKAVLWGAGRPTTPLQAISLNYKPKVRSEAIEDELEFTIFRHTTTILDFHGKSNLESLTVILLWQKIMESKISHQRYMRR